MTTSYILPAPTGSGWHNVPLQARRPAPKGGGYPATEKQLSFFARLVAERPRVSLPEWILEIADKVNPMHRDGKTISNAIDALMRLPRPEREAPTAAPGFHMLDGTMYAVVESQENPGRFYAKVLNRNGNKGNWTIARGMIYKLSQATKVTLEQAKEYGHLHGHCCICGRTLSDPKSVEQGIGPVCAGKVG